MKLVAMLLCVALAIACGTVPGVAPGTSVPGASIPPDLTIPPEVSMPPDLGDFPVELFVQAAEEAAAAGNVTPEQVSVVRAESVTWPTPALGCPEPGQMYLQVLTPGFWLVLSAGGREFDFRANSQGAIKLCPPGQGEPPIEDRL